MRKGFVYIALSVLLAVLFYLELRFGSTTMESVEFWERLRAFDDVIMKHRLPAALTAALGGASLSLSGWLLQTLFRNPLAGPSILGITSGSSLMVALVLLSGISFSGGFGSLSIVTSSLIGAGVVLFVILTVSLRVGQLATVLIFGLMISYLLGAFQSVLLDAAGESSLKKYISWGLASFGRLENGQIWVMTSALTVSIIAAFRLRLKLDNWLLGEEYARSLGVKPKSFRIILLAVSGCLAGVVTAYCGPVAFLGLAMPHAVKLFFNEPRHGKFIGVLVLSGACAGMLCEFISRMPWSETRLPLNAVTSLMGAPVVIWLLFKSRKIRWAS